MGAPGAIIFLSDWNHLRGGVNQRYFQEVWRQPPCLPPHPVISTCSPPTKISQCVAPKPIRRSPALAGLLDHLCVVVAIE